MVVVLGTSSKIDRINEYRYQRYEQERSINFQNPALAAIVVLGGQIDAQRKANETKSQHISGGTMAESAAALLDQE